MIPDWLIPTFALLPLAAWMFWGVGIPWALALLPRHDWADRVTVIALGMALGPVGLTAIMFLFGTFGTIRLATTLGGSAILAAVGAVLAWRTYRRFASPPKSPSPTGLARGTYRARAAAPFRMEGGAGDEVKKRPYPRLILNWHQTRRAGHRPAPTHRLGRGERALIAAIALMVLINVVITAYWPFLAYDVLWVYGHNARVFFLERHIPAEIGYYPPLIPLSYTFMQQGWGAINDHAARVVIPWFNVTAILMAYVLGRKVFESRRVGLLTAAIWALYPHAAAWSGAGDLEAPLTMYVTGAAAFFVEAWRTGRARSAVISGLLLGGALWTKPTAGAFALGIGLAAAGGLAAARFRWRVWRPLLRIALIAGVASAPLGGAWYLRNLIAGHAAVEFPADYWHNFAQRSGQELGWPLLIAALVAGGLAWRARSASLGGDRAGSETRPYPNHGFRRGGSQTRPWRKITRGYRGRVLLPLIALALLIAGVLPTALDWGAVRGYKQVWLWVRGDLGAGGRLQAGHVALITAGIALLAWQGRDAWRSWPRARREAIGLVWALLLPYAGVWFWDFSYHYRLSFAIVPLLAVQAAALIDGWAWDALAAHRAGRAVGALILAGGIAAAAAAATEHTLTPVLHGGLPDDTAKYDAGNPALMRVVHALEARAAEIGRPPVVAIPGEDRLPFFFMGWDIRTSRDDLPTRLEDLDGVDVFVNNSIVRFLLQRAGLWPNSLQADADVGAAYHTNRVTGPDGAPWPTVLAPIPLHPDGSVPIDDGNFRYEMYTIHPAARFTPLHPVAPVEGTVVIGEFAQFLGHDVVNLIWQRGERIRLALYWRPTGSAPPPRDYGVFIHLLDADGTVIARWDGAPLLGQYPTRFWRPGESLYDMWILRVPADLPPGPASVAIGLYDPIEQAPLGITVDGRAAGESVVINTRITVK